MRGEWCGKLGKASTGLGVLSLLLVGVITRGRAGWVGGGGAGRATPRGVGVCGGVHLPRRQEPRTRNCAPPPRYTATAAAFVGELALASLHSPLDRAAVLPLGPPLHIFALLRSSQLYIERRSGGLAGDTTTK